MHFPQLTFPRYIAACIVLMVHFANIDEVMTLPVVGNIIRNGNTLLSYFFVLTGFTLVVSLKRNKLMPTSIPPRLVLVYRMIRLYPLHWVALALTLLLGQLEGWFHPLPYQPTVEPGKLLAHVLLLHAWYPVQSFVINFNYVSWFLCVDLLFALLAPWLYQSMVKWKTSAMVRTVALLWLVSLLCYQMSVRLGVPIDWVFLWPPCHILEFMVGMAGGFLVCRHLPVLQRRVRLLHGLAYCCAALMIGLMGLGVDWLYRSSLPFAPCYLIIILSITLSDNWLTRLFHTKPFMYLGKVSFGVYILQFPVAILILRCLHPWLNWPYRYSALLFVVVLTGVAALGYEWVEKPVVTYAKKRLGRQPVQPEPVPTPVSPAVAPAM